MSLTYPSYILWVWCYFSLHDGTYERVEGMLKLFDIIYAKMSYPRRYVGIYEYASRWVYQIIKIEVRRKAKTSPIFPTLLWTYSILLLSWLFLFPMSVLMYAALPYLMALFSPLLKVEKYVSFETCAKIYKKSILIRTDQCELNLIVSTIKCIMNYVAR